MTVLTSSATHPRPPRFSSKIASDEFSSSSKGKGSNQFIGYRYFFYLLGVVGRTGGSHSKASKQASKRSSHLLAMDDDEDDMVMDPTRVTVRNLPRGVSVEELEVNVLDHFQADFFFFV
jgi:hypothetical protein